jgi:nucleotide-binding universal stress UspA family protein
VYIGIDVSMGSWMGSHKPRMPTRRILGKEMGMKKILVGVDGSQRAHGVLDASVDLAKLLGAKLLLVRAIGLPPAMPPHVWALEEGSLIDALRHDAEKYLAECVAKVPPELLIGARASIGVPWQAVCDEAKKDDVDLIVVGSHGYSGVDRLLGTTAAKVVNHADRSVLVIRKGHPLP